MTQQSAPEIVVRDAQPTAVIRTRARMDQLTEFYDRTYSAVAGLLGAQGIAPQEAFGLYGPMSDGEVDVEAGFTVDRAVQAGDDVVAAELPAGEYAHLTHVGAYGSLPESWGRLGGWIKEQGRTSGQTVFEIYTDDPTSTDVAELRTDLYWSLAD